MRRRGSPLALLFASAVTAAPGLVRAAPPAAPSAAPPTAAGDLSRDLRIDGLSTRPPEPLLVFVLRGAGVSTPLSAFHETARAAAETHMHVRVVSMEEAFVRGGSEFQQKLADCRGEDQCYARLAGSVQADYLLVITATALGDQVVLGSRFLDLRAIAVLGDAIDAVPRGANILDSVSERIQASVPPDLWDPFGGLVVSVNVEGSEVSINGRVAGLSPIPPIGFLLPGVYKVSAQKPGFTRAETAARVERGERASAELTLEEEATGSSGWLIWALIGVAAAGVATGVALAVTRGDPVFCSSPDPAACD